MHVIQRSLRAANLNGSSRPSAPTPINALLSPLALNNPPEVTLTWPTVPNAVDYAYEKSINGAAWLSGGANNPVTTLIEEIDPGALYFYRVRARNAQNVYSSWVNSPAILTPPTISQAIQDDTDLYVVNLLCTDTDNVTLTVEASGNNGQSWVTVANGQYTLAGGDAGQYILNTSAAYTLTLVRETATQTALNLTDNNSTGQARVRVKVSRSSYTSPYNTSPNIAGTNTPLAAPSPAAVIDPGSTPPNITVTWTDMPNATNYDAQYRYDSGAWQNLGTFANNENNFGGPFAYNKQVDFRMRSTNANETSPWSALNTVYTQPEITDEIPNDVYNYAIIADTRGAGIEVQIKHDTLTNWTTVANGLFNTPATLTAQGSTIAITKTGNIYEIEFIDNRYLLDYQNNNTINPNQQYHIRIRNTSPAPSEWSKEASFAGGDSLTI